MTAFVAMAALVAMLPNLPRTHQAVPPALKGVARIVCLGDSITQQGEKPVGYVWLLRHYLNTIYRDSPIEVINAGVSGHKSSDMLARFQRDVLDHKPDLVLISVGVNDVWHGFYDGHTKGDGPLGIPLSDYRSNVQKMILAATEARAKVILLLATQIGEDPKTPENLKALAYNNTLRALAEEFKCGLVDLQTPFRRMIAAYRETTGNTENILTVDGVHMNVEGNRVMAHAILSALGVPDSVRLAAHEAVESQLAASRPHPGPLPSGQILSDNKPATASSEFSEKYGADQANLAEKTFDQRWCVNSDKFVPNPWWQVDLGKSYELRGVHIVFAPEEPDTWKYKVLVSEDGVAFHDVVDRSKANEYFSEENHRFLSPVAARYVKVLFTAETSAQNWASLRHVQVFGNETRK